MVKVGKLAPEFTVEALVGTEFKDVSLSDYKGKWVVLYFWPLDFTFICPTEITEFNARYEDFVKLGAEVLGCSTDSVHSHKAWMKELGQMKYPLLSDKTLEISRQYDVLIEEKGIAFRGIFMIDPEGILRYSVVHDLSVGRNIDEVLRVLKALQTGELCPVGWKPGEKTLGKA